MRRSFVLGVLAVMMVMVAGAQTSVDSKSISTTPMSADAIVQNALKKAGKEHKNVIVMFHASWCVWCHRMDSSMNDASCRKFFDDNYVVAHLVVMESPDKKNLENPAAMEMLTRYHGNDQGIPFWVVLDKDGKLLGDSQIRPEGAALDTKGENMGCPAKQNEVDAFIKVLKKTSKLSEQQGAAIVKRFRQNDSH